MKNRNVEKISKFAIKLESNGKYLGIYRVNQKMFNDIKKQIEPYRSFGAAPKRVMCVETEQIFDNAREANNWLLDIEKCKNPNGINMIKDACRKNRLTYGYHWRFVE